MLLIVCDLEIVNYLLPNSSFIKPHLNSLDPDLGLDLTLIENSSLNMSDVLHQDPLFSEKSIYNLTMWKTVKR